MQIPGNQLAKLSVMVFVHGGKFEFGSSDSKLYAPDYLLNYDVILVTLNYRLGALGEKNRSLSTSKLSR